MQGVGVQWSGSLSTGVRGGCQPVPTGDKWFVGAMRRRATRKTLLIRPRPHSIKEASANFLNNEDLTRI